MYGVYQYTLPDKKVCHYIKTVQTLFGILTDFGHFCHKIKKITLTTPSTRYNSKNHGAFCFRYLTGSVLQ